MRTGCRYDRRRRPISQLSLRLVGVKGRARGQGRSERTRDLVLAPGAREILDVALRDVNMIRSAGQAAEKNLNQALALIGDKHGVDLFSGKYNIDETGAIVTVKQEKAPANDQVD